MFKEAERLKSDHVNYSNKWLHQVEPEPFYQRLCHRFTPDSSHLSLKVQMDRFKQFDDFDIDLGAQMQTVQDFESGEESKSNQNFNQFVTEDYFS